MRNLLALFFMILLPLVAKAQFTIVDSESGEPIPGVYVFGENGSLICMSDDKGVVDGAKGMVTFSMLSYEPMTVDATNLTGKVKLVSQPLALNEVVVGKTDFMKISGTFRDVVANSGTLVMYREGIMDFYYNISAKKWTRRIRAARQLEHENLRKLSYIDSLYSGVNVMFDLSRVREISAEEAEQHGDTIVFSAKKGNAIVNDAGMIYKHNGLYHVVIDGIKVSKHNSLKLFGSTFEYKMRLTDWAYSDPSMSKSSFAAFRYYGVEENRTSKNSPLIVADKTSDFVVNSITYLTKSEAKEEMKDKERATEFELPNCLPAIPSGLTDQIKNLKPTKLKEM